MRNPLPAEIAAAETHMFEILGAFGRAHTDEIFHRRVVTKLLALDTNAEGYRWRPL